MNNCENCYWFELTNNQQLKGVCHNPHRRIVVVSEYCCELFKSKIEQQMSRINMNMKELRAVLKDMGVSEERRGATFIFRKDGKATTAKQKTELGHIVFYEKETFLGEESWLSSSADKIIEYFK